MYVFILEYPMVIFYVYIFPIMPQATIILFPTKNRVTGISKSNEIKEPILCLTKPIQKTYC